MADKRGARLTSGSYGTASKAATRTASAPLSSPMASITGACLAPGTRTGSSPTRSRPSSHQAPNPPSSCSGHWRGSGATGRFPAGLSSWTWAQKSASGPGRHSTGPQSPGTPPLTQYDTPLVKPGHRAAGHVGVPAGSKSAGNRTKRRKPHSGRRGKPQMVTRDPRAAAMSEDRGPDSLDARVRRLIAD